MDKIIDYLKNNLCNEEAAKNFFLELSEKLELICDFPKTSPVIKNRFIDFLEIRKFAIKRYLVYYYIDEEELNLGDIIQMEGSSGQYVLTETDVRDGVYNLNKGYAVFRQAEILSQNEEYTIVKKGVKYGVQLYDRIALDSTSIKEGELNK